MIKTGIDLKLLFSTILLAFGLWFFTFYLGLLNFWIKISFSALILGALSIWAHTLKHNKLNFDRTAFLQGIMLAAALYFIFWAGKFASSHIFSFAPQQISAIYNKGTGFSQVAVFFLLLFITGPCEEIYWRGFIQNNLMKRYGESSGWIITTMIYTAVHICSLNFMLVGAAAVAGAFWGLLYMKLRRLDTLIICHSVWSACIFTLLPLN